jgi:predicted DNA-binding protein YlxM (UPF0122 family)
MGKIHKSQLDEVKKMYYADQFCMREIAEKLKVSVDAVVYFMKRYNLKRRSFFEINKMQFARKKPSFKPRSINTQYLKELRVAGAMLYWGEGFKSEKGSIVDFTNSDYKMIIIFLNFLRRIYRINEKKLRVLLYCYSNQDTKKLINFWSRLTKIPEDQFTKPYIRKDFDTNTHRKMQNGLIHIRYCDKKLFLEIMKLINQYVIKYSI